MQFTRLRLSGFKSFVDPTELHIEVGMTGIVGPNGCGKSNLVEALRWVMGEGSAKSLRGSAMDDVIFSGAASRPARNAAEVSLLLDNRDRRATAAFNDSEALEVSRRIEREAGSTYRVNGREARARDVQLLFADSATGAHSPALVRQGQISGLINAKPAERRAILEEAAGISGLHARRHEAELRLRATEANLTRLADLMAEIENRLAALRRQARQAMRYRTLSVELRAAEVLVLVVRWAKADGAFQTARQALHQAESLVETATREAARAAASLADANAVLPDLRAAEAEEAAALQRITRERDRLLAEERHTRDRCERDRAALERATQDETRESTVLRDSQRSLERNREELGLLRAEREGEAAAREAAETRVAEAAGAATEREQAHDALREQLAALRARRQSLEREHDQGSARLRQLAGYIGSASSEQDALTAQEPAPLEPQAASDPAARVETARNAVGAAEQGRASAQETETAAREALRAAETEAARLHAEAKAIERMIGGAGHESLWPPMIDAVSVPRGLETALAAALGEGLNAPGDEAAPVHWTTLPPYEAPPHLPGGVESLGRLVTAPPALSRALALVGLVIRSDAARLRAQLLPGQCLVSREGDLWRWDGYTASAEAPSAAARGLEQRNRLRELTELCQRADALIVERRGHVEQARAALSAAAGAETEARQALRAAEAELERERQRQVQAERAEAQRQARLTAVTDRLAQLRQDEAETRARIAAAGDALAELAPEARLEEELGTIRREMEALRRAAAEARGAADSLRRETDMRARRAQLLEREAADWVRRVKAAGTHLEELTARKAELSAQIAEIAELPAQLAEQAARLAEALAEGESRRKSAADALASAESRAAEAARTARATEQALAEAREQRAGHAAAAQAAAETLRQAASELIERTGVQPGEAKAQLKLADEEFPQPDEVQARIEKLRRDRDALGAVNLRAEEEMTELRAQLSETEIERRDLEEAIARLRKAIASLNREGRARLLEAFARVNDHFSRLFAILFEGGEAKLALVESDDPLEAGLEITARPPGKKPQVLSLLSGGEQALTALALIFAVFQTNPAPICVLDEVDAPLDDANVDRFCRLVQEMAKHAATRFLIITHHPLTMARMDRLYGVTMVEQGVSQLVSVDLSGARALRAAS